jgi:hypothetical protein
MPPMIKAPARNKMRYLFFNEKPIIPLSILIMIYELTG